jgi:phage-related protein
MVNITISFTGANNDTIVFDNQTYTLETGLSGFGIPQPLLRIDKSAGNGGVFRLAKREVRDLDVPILVTNDNGQTVEANLRRLANILRGRVTITATYATGEVYFLYAYLAGGGDSAYGSGGNQSFARWVLQLQAPQPFWTAAEPEEFSVATSGATRGLLTGPLTELRVSSSQAIGTVSIENPGDVESPIVWQLRGPSTSVSISLNGVGFIYDGTLLVDQTVTIDVEAGTVINQAGTNVYANLAAAPKLFYIPAGDSTIDIIATGADTNTRISGFYSPRREVIH